MRRRLARRWRRARPTAGVVVLAWCLLAASLGIVPSPARLVSLFAGVPAERFPCEDCGCGCSSAHECWTECCCHTLEQRVAWARAQAVAIPSYVDLSPLRAPTRLAGAEPACPLCVDDGDSRAGTSAEGVAQPVAEADRAPLIPVLSPLACKRVPGWVLIAPIPAPKPVADGIVPVLTETRVAAVRDRAPTPPTLDTPTPPPRRA